MREEACLATRVRKEASEQQLAARTSCLERRGAELGAVTQLLRAADAPLVQRSVQLVHGMTPVTDCAGTHLLLGGWRLGGPENAELETQRRTLGSVHALTRAARFTQAREQLDPVLLTGRSSGETRLHAEALLEDSKLCFATGDRDGAERSAREALRLALAHRDDALAADAGNHLLYMAVDYHLPERGSQWVPVAEGIVARLDPLDRRRAEFLGLAGYIASQQHRYDEATGRLEAAMAMWSRIPDHDPLAEAITANRFGGIHIDSGRLTEAKKWLEHSLEIKRSIFPANHPQIAFSLGNLGRVHMMGGSFAAAERLNRQTFDILHQVYGQTHVFHSRASVNLAAPLSMIGRAAESVALIGGALAFYERTLPKDSELFADAWVERGVAYAQLGRHREAAVDLEKSIAALEKAHGAATPALARPLTWLAGALLELRRPKDALPLLEQAVTLRYPGAEPAEATWSRVLLAKALRANDQDPARAAALLAEVASATHLLSENQRATLEVLNVPPPGRAAAPH